MKSKRRTKAAQASKWIGHTVCVGLKNGDYYVGRVVGVRNGELILSGMQGQGKLTDSFTRQDKAKVSGLLDSLLGGLGGLDGGNDGANPLGGGDGAATGLFGKLWPMIRVGIGMLQFIMPLVRKFFV
ncbi:hypothetical protein PACILC2_11630 [Paenibacillus cisolokensis]|jgi:hypothetical protein|uniref:Uncharacterized protein n=1 Tax=Paenibacillus cisolokensis TaxID=1658519 RepID=A0ABQ4N349_9BACL|nr:hypothetical protein [Paenibacillus cisolokensis]GIQ62595.1 hypothetical protein PACILC2_11630 [Paenibacillus cisolokensis]